MTQGMVLIKNTSALYNMIFININVQLHGNSVNTFELLVLIVFHLK